MCIHVFLFLRVLWFTTTLLKVLATFFQLLIMAFVLDIEWPKVLKEGMEKLAFIKFEFDIPSVSCIFRD